MKRACLLNYFLVLCCSFTLAFLAQAQVPYVTSNVNTTLVSFNDGEAGSLVTGDGSVVADSLTVINLSPTSAPITKTVYGLTSSTLLGAPHAAITGNFAVITNHTLRLDENLGFVNVDSSAVGKNQLVIMDLRTLKVTDNLQLDASPWLAKSVHNSDRVIVGLSTGWLVIKIDADGRIIKQVYSPFDVSVVSFDIDSNGGSILAGIQDRSGDWWLTKYLLRDDDTVVLEGRTKTNKFLIDAPFAPRIAPNGRSALVLNGGGFSDGVLDDVLLVDLAENIVVDSIRQVSDGLESVAIHPSGEFAVISGLNAMPWSVSSHLALISLSSDSPELLYSLPIEALPEGVEFSKDGEQLFVGSTLANHISVYKVEGMMLKRLPQVLPVGEGHVALGIAFGRM